MLVSKAFPDSCLYIFPSDCPCITNSSWPIYPLSAHVHAIPNVWANSKDILPWYSLNPPSIPCEEEVEKRYLNCDLLLTITEDRVDKFSASITPVIVDWIFLETVSRLTSPIFDVPPIGLIPSGAKNNKSPPNSTTLSVARHPKFEVTVSRVKLAEFSPTNLLILFVPNI